MTRCSSARTRSTCSMRAARSRQTSARPTSPGFASSPGPPPSRTSDHRSWMPSLLLEIGVEELPATACHEAEAQLPELARAHIGAPPSQLFVGPRRVGFLIESLPARSDDAWIKGPPEHLRDRAAA